MTRMDANAVLALMQVLSNPEATKARLAELMVQVDREEKVLDETRAKLKDIIDREAKLQLWENDLDNLNAALKSAQTSLEAERTRQSNAAKALDIHQSKLQEWSTQQSEDERALDKRDRDLKSREESLARSLVDLDAREKTLKAGEDSLKSRLIKMKELSNG